MFMGRGKYLFDEYFQNCYKNFVQLKIWEDNTVVLCLFLNIPKINRNDYKNIMVPACLSLNESSKNCWSDFIDILHNAGWYTKINIGVLPFWFSPHFKMTTIWNISLPKSLRGLYLFNNQIFITIIIKFRQL